MVITFIYEPSKSVQFDEYNKSDTVMLPSSSIIQSCSSYLQSDMIMTSVNVTTLAEAGILVEAVNLDWIYH